MRYATWFEYGSPNAPRQRMLDKPVKGVLTAGMDDVRIKTRGQQLAEHHYLPGRSLRTDVLEARKKGHSWRTIAERVNGLLAQNPNTRISCTHETLRQWYGDAS